MTETLSPPPLLPPRGLPGAPDCDTHNECRFVHDDSAEAIAATGFPLDWKPIYNRHGVLTNAPALEIHMKCTHCGKTFVRRAGGPPPPMETATRAR